MPKVNYDKGLFGIRRWKYVNMDDIDLLCEISIFLSCTLPGKCRPCKKHLKWCLKILQRRWDYVKYIDFYNALEVVKNNKQFFNDSLEFSYWKKDYIQQLISRK